MGESGSQRDIVAEPIAKLGDYPKANRWFKATENVVLYSDGNEAVLRDTLARAMEGRAGPGPAGASVEEEMDRLLGSMEELIGEWANSPHMS